MTADVRMQAAAFALALLAALAFAHRSWAAGSPASPAAPLGGVNIGSLEYASEPRDVDREMAEAHRLHAGIVRTTAKWSVLEPLAQGRLSRRALAVADRVIQDATAAGIRVIMTVEGSPCWASAAPLRLLRTCLPGHDSAANRWPPRDTAAYAAFAAILAKRYGTHLAAIEIWNEPDNSNERFFAGPDKAARYAALLRAAYPAVKAVNASVTVLGGSLVGSNGVFLRALYAAGIRGNYDGLSVHFYTLPLASLRSIRQVQNAAGDTTPLWLDEFGWSSCWPRYRTQQEQACVTEATQAANLRDLFRALALSRYVAAELLYDLRGWTSEDFGVLSETGRRKPAYRALARVLRSPGGDPAPVTLRLRREGPRIVATGSGPVGDYMQLEAFTGGAARYRALFVLDRFNRYSIRLPAGLGTHGVTVRVYQYWAGLAHAALGTL
jgi:hypothetical protein